MPITGETKKMPCSGSEKCNKQNTKFGYLDHLLLTMVVSGNVLAAEQ